MELSGLAAVDRGPIMKRMLMTGLKTEPFPHWISRALCRYFLQDEDVKLVLQEVLLGDEVLASKVANVAPVVLDSDNAIKWSLDILREINDKLKKDRARADIVVHALIEVCKAKGLTSGDVGFDIASQAIGMISKPDLVTIDPTYEIVVFIYIGIIWSTIKLAFFN